MSKDTLQLHVKNDPINLTARDKKSISKDLEKIMLRFDNDEHCPLDDDDKACLRVALQHALEIIKIENKLKYTPKKYLKL